MSPEQLQLAPYVGAAALVLLFLGLNAYLEAKRRREFAEEALRLGFAAPPEGEGGWPFDQGHALFSLGRGQAIDNLVQSSHGARSWIFDYEYTTGSGKSRSRHTQTVAAFETPASLPRFQMFPEQFYHWFAELVGFKDIDFDDNKQFSDQYRLLAEDEAAIRRLFNPPAVSRLAALPGWSVEGAGRILLVYQASKIAKPAALGGFVERTREIARNFSAR